MFTIILLSIITIALFAVAFFLIATGGTIFAILASDLIVAAFVLWLIFKLIRGKKK